MKLSSEQHKAVTSEKSQTVIASAGTGKTTVLTERFLHLHQNQKIPLDNLLAFTFTDKACREMKNRVLKKGDFAFESFPLLKITTLHSFCFDLLKKHGQAIGLDSSFEIFEPHAYMSWLSHEMNREVRRAIDYQDKSFLDFFHAYGEKNTFKVLRSFLTQESIFFSTDNENQFTKWVKNLSEQLLQKRIQNHLLSYQDLEILTLRLLEDKYNIINNLQNSCKEILVDEFQDISPLQKEIIERLYNPNTNRLFIVGDAKQSIYLFRKADVKVFQDMSNSINNNGGEEQWLTTTYRTPSNLTKVFNESFDPLLNQNQKLYSPAISELHDHEAKIYSAALPDQSLSSSEIFQKHQTQILRIIETLLRSGVEPENIAILSQTRKPFQSLKEKFTELNIPYMSDAKDEHFDHPMIKFLFHAFLCLQENIKPVHWLGFLRSPYFPLSDKALRSLEKFPNEDINTLKAADKESWEKLKAFYLNWLKLAVSLKPTEVCRRIYQDLNHRSSDNLQAFSEFYRFLISLEKNGCDSLSQAMPLLELWEKSHSQFDSLKIQPNGIQLLTIHGAKGLEFDHVILIPSRPKPTATPIFLEDKNSHKFVFLNSDIEKISTLKVSLEESEEYQELKKEQQADQKNEQKRLFYVALTRTKKSLYLLPPKPSSQKFAKELQENFKKLPDNQTYNNLLAWFSKQNGIESLDNFFNESGKKQNQASDEQKEKKCFDFELKPSNSIPTFSVSELEWYHECPVKYFLKTQRALPGEFLPQKKTTKASFTAQERGVFLHEVLQFFDPERGNLDNVVEQALFNQHLADSSNELKSLAEELINKISAQKSLSDLLYKNEKSFSELDFFFKIKNAYVSGQIDKLIYKNQSAVIVDYKTHQYRSEDEKNRLAKNFEFQLKCYALALIKKEQIKTIEAVVLFTHTGESIHNTWSEAELRKFESHLNEITLDLIENQKHAEFPYSKTTEPCQSCIYFQKDSCERKSKNPDGNKSGLILSVD